MVGFIFAASVSRAEEKQAANNRIKSAREIASESIANLDDAAKRVEDWANEFGKDCREIASAPVVDLEGNAIEENLDFEAAMEAVEITFDSWLATVDDNIEYGKSTLDYLETVGQDANDPSLLDLQDKVRQRILTFENWKTRRQSVRQDGLTAVGSLFVKN